MKVKGYDKGRTFLGRLSHGADLITELREFCRQNGIRTGVFAVIGALKSATLGFYDQEKKEYDTWTVDEELEIISCQGNVSLRDGEPAVHAHAALSDASGNTVSGHLLSDTIVFAGEIYLQELVGEDLVRGHDEVTGLPLWEL